MLDVKVLADHLGLILHYGELALRRDHYMAICRHGPLTYDTAKCECYIELSGGAMARRNTSGSIRLKKYSDFMMT